MEKYLKIISANIRRRRIDADLTQKDLAKEINRTDRFISTLETNPEDIKLSTLYDIADALGCTVFDLMEPSDTRPTAKKRASKDAKEVVLRPDALAGLEAAISLISHAKRNLLKRKK